MELKVDRRRSHGKNQSLFWTSRSILESANAVFNKVQDLGYSSNHKRSSLLLVKV